MNYREYIAENLEETINYSEYLAEHLDKNIKYSEYLDEHLDSGGFETEAQKAKRIRVEREKKLKRIYVK